MKKQRLPRHIVYAAISLSFPIITVIAVNACQSVVHADFWQSLTSDDNAAGAMMAASEAVQLIVFSMVGCLIGISFAAAALFLQQRIWGIGLVALVFNGLSFLFLIFLWIKGITVGL